MTEDYALFLLNQLCTGASVEAMPIIPQYEFSQALNVAIKALKQQICEDCISREKAKQFLYERLDRLNDDELYDIFSRIIDDMYNELPPVKPKTDSEVEK